MLPTSRSPQTQKTVQTFRPDATHQRIRSAPDLPLRLSPARHLRLCWLSATILDMNSGFMPSAQLEGPLGLLWPPLRRREVTRPCVPGFPFSSLGHSFKVPRVTFVWFNIYR